MSITYFEKERVFKLDTPSTSYVIGIACEEGFVGHLYYGKRLDSIAGITENFRLSENPFTPERNDRDRVSFFDVFPCEYSSSGVGDFRESSIRVKDQQGHWAVSLFYQSHQIYNGKEKLPGMPATFGTDEDVTSLVILCKDPVTGLEVELKYSAFEKVDAITRNVRVINQTKDAIYLEKVMSGCMDMEDLNYDVMTLHGSWARERHIEKKPLGHGKFNVSTLRGESSHQEHPFMALLADGACQDRGEVYGFHFVYSGNFLVQAEQSQFGSVRIVMGINPEEFGWKLEQGEAFQTPEMVLVYSDEGIGKMTRSFHDLYRNHLIRSPWLHKKRPILINNWEATYFDFDTDKIISIARESAKLGIEMLVLDDGWFGNRFDDNRALGDWEVNTDKVKGGMDYLASEINKLGMKFGLWFEPEMISPESKLYEEHPDWAIAIPERRAGRARNQLVLDVSRKEVRDHILDKMFKVLHGANIEYVKWDMNRPLTDLASVALPADRQGELFHRYVLGMYEMQERLLQEFPNLLLENCSGGGGRFDPGMLYYGPQIWCSDDTDAVERLMIQEGTSLIYPLCCMGAHVSVCPNHVMGRTTPFATRGMVALAGTFGYELDVTKLSDEDKAMVPRQVEMYHAFNDLVREGDYYRIASYLENHLYDCFQVGDKEGKQSLVFYTQVIGQPNMHSRCIRLKGLSQNNCYRIYTVSMDGESLLQDAGRVVNGGILMQSGMIVERLWGDYQSKLFYLEAVEQ